MARAHPKPYMLAMEDTTMADTFESLSPGDVVVTRPKRPEEQSKALGEGWAPMLLLSNFRDNAGRRWAVAVPLEPSNGDKAIALHKLQPVTPHTTLRTPLRARMVPQPDRYAFLPLFQGPAPFLRNPSSGSLLWGQAEDPFAARDAHKDVVEAHGRGVTGYRVGIPEDTVQRTSTPVRTRTQVAQAQAHNTSVSTHASTTTDDLISMLPTPLRQAQALGAAKAEAHMASVPDATAALRAAQARAYGVPVVSKPTVSLTM
jgi:hypothetical protein